jgi:hypothetical protein
LTQKEEVIDAPGQGQERVAPRDEQNKEWKLNWLQHSDGQRMRLHVMDGNERLPVLPHELEAEMQADA